jgi:RNA polymerase sigma-70 factor (ECF subfamily)
MTTDHHENVTSDPRPFETLRGRLFGMAYRMLGSRADAEDVVQEAYVRWHQADQQTIRSPEAWLVTTTTRLAIDRLRALKAERDAYTGPWLPEPLMSDAPPPPDRHVDLASDLSIAFLVLLERLAPDERAAFLLHDVFDSSYADIAALLDKSEAACRQIVHRARERVRSERARFEVTETARVSLLKKFVAAVEATDDKALLALFAPDATWTADGGGRTAAAPRPIAGADRIVPFIIGLQRRLSEHGATMHLAEINGEAGLIIRVDDDIKGAISIATDGDRILAVYAVINPDKLRPGSSVN